MVESMPTFTPEHLAAVAAPLADDRVGAVGGVPPAKLTLAAYAALTGLSEAEVWRRLQNGDLTGRHLDGQIIIEAGNSPRDIESLDFGSLPPPPLDGDFAPLSPPRSGAAATERPLSADFVVDEDSSAPAEVVAPADARAMSPVSPPPEMALLLDHLSLAKEENREILRLTQESIRKITSMSDALIEMKDALLDAKDVELAALRQQLAARDQDLTLLKQKHEDLEMLARSLAESAAQP